MLDMKLTKLFGYFNNAITGCFVFVLVLGVEFFAWLRGPTDLVPAWCFYLFQLAMIIFACVGYACLRYQYDTKCLSVAIPVRYVRDAYKVNGWALIVHDSPLLQLNRVVSVCFSSKDDDIEETIAIGYVETKNNKGNYQIFVPKEWNLGEHGLQEYGQKLLMVKPTVDKCWIS